MGVITTQRNIHRVAAMESAARNELDAGRDRKGLAGIAAIAIEANGVITHCGGGHYEATTGVAERIRLNGADLGVVKIDAHVGIVRKAIDMEGNRRADRARIGAKA